MRLEVPATAWPGLRSLGDAKSGVMATAELEWFGSGATSEAREPIVHEGPVYTVVEVHVKLGDAVDRSFHVGKNDIDMLGVPGRLAKKGASATAAEASRPMLRGRKSHQCRLFGFQFELRVHNPEPRDKTSTVTTTAHGAVAVTATERRGLDGETHVSAKAGAGISASRS